MKSNEKEKVLFRHEIESEGYVENLTVTEVHDAGEVSVVFKIKSGNRVLRYAVSSQSALLLSNRLRG